MLRAMVVASAVLAGPVWADDWVALAGDTALAALDGRTLQYSDARQVFYASGRTLYDHGRPSWGNWAVRGGQYCSQWPPQDGWNCFVLERHSGDGRLRFVSETGAVTEGQIVE